MSNLVDGWVLRPHRGIIGHRGVAGIAPENTLAGFRKAAALGLNWVEFDVQRCASGEWILMHDHTLARTTNGHGFVSKVSYDRIKNLDAGSWFSAKFRTERVPLLAEALHCLLELNIHPNIEIKSFSPPPPALAKSFLMQLTSFWPASKPLPLVSSFNLELLIQLRKAHPSLPIGYLIKNHPQLGVKKALHYHFNTLHCSHKAFHHLTLLPLVAKHIPILIYTINNYQRIEALLQAGATAVFSDLTNIVDFTAKN